MSVYATNRGRIDKISKDELTVEIIKFLNAQPNFVTNSEITWELSKQLGWDGPYPQHFQDRCVRILEALVLDKAVVKYKRDQSYPDPLLGQIQSRLHGGPYWATPELDAKGRWAVKERKRLEGHYGAQASDLHTRLVSSGCTPTETSVGSDHTGLKKVSMLASDAIALLDKIEKGATS